MIRAAALRAAAMIAVAVASLPGATTPAEAATAPGWTSGACPTSSGVTVVVDFSALGGGDVVRCTGGDPRSGLEALTMVGFSYSFVPRQPGFVCQIGGEPDPCNGGPADAYWSYWHASRGSSWAYSNAGAGSRDPAPGSVEGWAFGAGARPSTSPPPPTTATTTTTRPATPTPPPTTQPPAAAPTAPPGTAAPTTVTPGDGGPAGDVSTTSTPSTTGASGDDTTSSTTATTGTDGPSGADRSDDETAAADDPDRPDDEVAGGVEITEEDDGGVGTGAVAVGAGAVALFAGAALWETRRRSGP